MTSPNNMNFLRLSNCEWTKGMWHTDRQTDRQTDEYRKHYTFHL